MGLNRTRELSGGGSGYRSESRREPVGDGKYKFEGTLFPQRVVKTLIYYKKTESVEAEVNGEIVVGTRTTVKTLSQPNFIPIPLAFNTMPFTFKVVYVYGDKTAIGSGETITVTNVAIR